MRGYLMYNAIMVAIDNSPDSVCAENLAVQVARATGSPVTGLHAYTGRYHRSRFHALEDHLPERYKKEDVLEHQRSIHSVLIERGLELISLEYMKRLKDRCMADGISFTELIADGKNSDVIINASRQSGLVAMGAEGLGRIEGVSRIGSNTRRMLRYGACDLVVARNDGPVKTILAAIDGSDDAYRMVEKAAMLSKSLDAALVIGTSFDPGLHRTVFGSLSGVLSPSAGNVFRFSEQESLHNEIIDKSLARLYTGYLEKAGSIAAKKGVKAGTVLLQGKPYVAICEKATEIAAELIAVGRTGMHRGDFGDIGSNAENIVEYAQTSVLVVTGRHPQQPREPAQSLPQPAEPLRKNITWSAEAEKRLEHVPVFARPIATMAIERYAQENGYTVITPEVMTRARETMGI
jgi:nucleotide-binding universal stress UspA family protein